MTEAPVPRPDPTGIDAVDAAVELIDSTAEQPLDAHAETLAAAHAALRASLDAPPAAGA